MINLSSPKLNDGDIESLFTSLPRHCIVLLEDVDATQPLSRDLPKKKKSGDNDDDDDGEDDGGAEDDVSEVGKNMPPMPHHVHNPRVPGTKRRGNAVTLSGLLNAIDGVGASEGQSYTSA